MNGLTSPPLPIFSRVPQGSILGPLLFILYVSGITDLPLSPSTKLILYADDIFLFHHVFSHSDPSILQSDLNTISAWLSSPLLHLNSSKSKYMFFSCKSPIFDYFYLSISNDPLEVFSLFCYLGVTLSSSLSWSPVSPLSAAKPEKFLDSYFTTFTPTPLLLPYYVPTQPLFNPTLSIASSVWDPSSSSLAHSIESVQLFALKLSSHFLPTLSLLSNHKTIPWSQSDENMLN